MVTSKKIQCNDGLDVSIQIWMFGGFQLFIHLFMIRRVLYLYFLGGHLKEMGIIVKNWGFLFKGREAF